MVTGSYANIILEADHALIGSSLRCMSPSTVKEILPYQNAFEVSALKEVAPLVQDIDNAWNTAKMFVVLFARKFIQHKRRLDLSVLRLRAHSGAGRCPLCQDACPTETLPCCGQGMHRKCWIEWQLAQPKHCLLCRYEL